VQGIKPFHAMAFGNPELAERLGLSRTFKFGVRLGTDVRTMAAQFSAVPNVEFAEIDGIGGPAFTPNDPLIGNCWGLNNTGQQGGTVDADVDAFEAWDHWQGADNLIIAVIDTGVNDHPDFVGRKIPGWNTFNNTNNTQDVYGHGTHVAGTVAANGNNGIGIAGMDWKVKVMPVRVLSDFGSGTEAQCAAGIVWATDHGANIGTMSLQYYTGSQTFADSVNYAYGQGVLLIAATGNGQGNIVAYPARFPHCAGIGATTRYDTIASWSNYGAQVDVSAPGEDVYSFTNSNGYTYLSGTSMATPHASGMGALMWSYDRGMTPDEVMSVITGTADDKGPVGWDNRFGWGRINANGGILKVKEPLAGFTSMSVLTGTLMGGTVASLFSSDSQAVQIQSIIPLAVAAPSVRLQAEGTAPDLPFNRVQILLEAAASTDNVMQTVHAFDFVNGTWVQVDSRPATTTEAFTVVNITDNPSRFVQAGSRTIRARVSFYNQGAPVPTWTTTVDQFRGALRNN
nr:S8 family serine peptidase [Armatimonadota bacterium]